jgi:lipopolysaccharide O-acetyltransferase
MSLKETVRRYRDEPLARIALRARLTRPYWRRRFYAFGNASILDRPNWVYGPHQIDIGDGVLIFKSAWLSVERAAWRESPPVLKIGNGVAMRPYCTVSAAESITIEDGVVLAAYTTVVDNDHVHVGGENPNIVWGGGIKSAPIRIGRGTWVGERVSILKGSDIGRYCTIGANSVVRGTIPDHSVAVGAPARVVGTTSPTATR